MHLIYSALSSNVLLPHNRFYGSKRDNKELSAETKEIFTISKFTFSSTNLYIYFIPGLYN